MSFWSKIKEFFDPQQKAESSDWIAGRANFSAWANNGFSNSGNGVLTTNEAVFSIITRLADTVASLPIHLYRKGEVQQTNTINLVRTEPNPNMTGYEMMNVTETARNTSGNGYLLIERDPATGTPVKLWPIDPGYVVIKRNIDDNSIWYEIDSDNLHCVVFNTEIIHVKHISPLGGLYGISPIDVLRRSLKFEKDVQDFSLEEMNKKDAFIIKYDRGINPDGAQRVLQNFRKMIKANGGAVLLQAGYDIDRYESKFKPAELSEIEAISRTRIANAFNVPLSFLNDGQAKSTTNVEHVMTQFVQMTLLPIVRQYEAEFNRKLLTQSQRARGYYFKFNVNGLMRGDTAARTQFYQTLIRNGVATENEIRALEDLPPLKDESADKLWISKDLYPSDSWLEASKQEIAGLSDKGGETENEQKDEQTSGLSDNQTESE